MRKLLGCAAALAFGILISAGTAVAAESASATVASGKGLTSPTGRIELLDRQMDTIKAGVTDTQCQGGNPHCTTTNPGGQSGGCSNNPNCNTKFNHP